MANPASPAIKAALPFVAIALLSTSAGFAIRSLTDPRLPAATDHDTPPSATPDTSAANSAPEQNSADLVAATLAKLGGAPPLDEVLASRGLARYEMLARYLATATAAECEAIHAELSKGGYRPHENNMLFLRWAEIDPLGALAANKHSTAWAWAKHNPDAAFSYLLEDGDASEALRGIAQCDPQRALELLRQHPEAGGQNSWEGIATGLARTDPRAGIEFALEHHYERLSDLEAVVRRWTYSDPDAAIAFATNIPDLRQRWHVVEDVLLKLEQDDPDRAFEVVNDLPPGQMRNDFRHRLIVSMATSDLDTAVESAQAIPRLADRTNTMRAIVQQIAPSDPDAAIDLFASLEPSPGTHLSHDALQSLAALRPERALEHGIYPLSIADLWVREDPEAASAWIAEQAGDPHYPEMVRGLIHGITQNANEPDYPSAAAWALSLDGQARDEQAQNVFRAWLESDAQAATQAMRQMTGLPDGLRQWNLLRDRTPIPTP